jgi:hypothetical protein
MLTTETRRRIKLEDLLAAISAPANDVDADALDDDVKTATDIVPIGLSQLGTGAPESR